MKTSVATPTVRFSTAPNATQYWSTRQALPSVFALVHKDAHTRAVSKPNKYISLSLYPYTHTHTDVCRRRKWWQSGLVVDVIRMQDQPAPRKRENVGSIRWLVNIFQLFFIFQLWTCHNRMKTSKLPSLNQLGGSPVLMQMQLVRQISENLGFGRQFFSDTMATE